MGRRRIHPPKGPAHGIARGVLQRAVLATLLSGEKIRVPVSGKNAGTRPPAGMSKGAWEGLQHRLSKAGYILEQHHDDYASGLYDVYSLIALVPDEGVGQLG